jgi:hypothetical protein
MMKRRQQDFNLAEPTSIGLQQGAATRRRSQADRDTLMSLASVRVSSQSNPAAGA